MLKFLLELKQLEILLILKYHNNAALELAIMKNKVRQATKDLYNAKVNENKALQIAQFERNPQNKKKKNFAKNKLLP